MNTANRPLQIQPAPEIVDPELKKGFDAANAPKP